MAGGGLSFLGLVLTSLLTEKSMDMIEGEELEYLGRKGKQDKVFWFCDVTWQLFLG